MRSFRFQFLYIQRRYLYNRSVRLCATNKNITTDRFINARRRKGLKVAKNCVKYWDNLVLQTQTCKLTMQFQCHGFQWTQTYTQSQSLFQRIFLIVINYLDIEFANWLVSYLENAAQKSFYIPIGIECNFLA